jgi:hypothetical protein
MTSAFEKRARQKNLLVDHGNSKVVEPVVLLLCYALFETFLPVLVAISHLVIVIQR